MPEKKSTIYDPNYTHTKGVRFGPITAPFPTPEDPDFELVCHHATGNTGLITELDDGNLYACIAMRPKFGDGVYSHYDVESCRRMAKALNRMADFIEEHNDA